MPLRYHYALAMTLVLAAVVLTESGCTSTNDHVGRSAHVNEKVAFVHVRAGVAHSREEAEHGLVIKWSAVSSIDETDAQAVNRVFEQAAEAGNVERRTNGFYMLLMPRIVTYSTDSFRVEKVNQQRSEEMWQVKFIRRSWSLQPPPSGHHIIVIPADTIAQDTTTLKLSFNCFTLGTGLESDPSELPEDDAVASSSLRIPDVILAFK